MLDFSDLPYRYFPPRYSSVWAWLLLIHNRRRHLPKVQRIPDIEVTGSELLQAASRDGGRLLFLPNHSTHADAAIFLEALRQVGRRSHLMAAYDVFLRGWTHRFAMQRLGAFAVDRDGSCPKPMKQALATLEAGHFDLTIFPEGNVYLTNDRVTPFLEGAGLIALQAQKALNKAEGFAGAVGRVWVVPVSIKATHRTNARARITQRFVKLVKPLEIEHDFAADPVAALHTAGGAALLRNLRQRGFELPDDAAALDLPALAERCAGQVLESLERKLERTPKAGESLRDRVRAARRLIHEVRSDPDRAVDHAAAAMWADEAMLAFRIASYPIGYAAEHPTIDRIGETVEKLEEDLCRRMPAPFADREAFVRFNEPIDVSTYLERHPKLRAAVRALTEDAEAAVQAGIDRLNHDNPHPGGRAW